MIATWNRDIIKNSIPTRYHSKTKNIYMKILLIAFWDWVEIIIFKKSKLIKSLRLKSIGCKWLKVSRKINMNGNIVISKRFLDAPMLTISRWYKRIEIRSNSEYRMAPARLKSNISVKNSPQQSIIPPLYNK